MSLLNFVVSVLFFLSLTISITVVAYLSNTQRVSSWAVDVWIIIALAILMVFVGKEVGANSLEMVGMIVIELLIAVPSILVMRKWRLKRLSQKDK